MERIIVKLEESGNWRDKLRRTCIKNQVSTVIATFFTPKRFSLAYRHFVEAQAIKSRFEGWMENQLKAYHWVLLVVSYAEDTTFAQFTVENWKLLAEIFYFKNPMLLKYQSRILVSKKGHLLGWQADEEKIYSQIMTNTYSSTNKWSLAALQLFEKSNEKFVRSGKQCREKWVNHLDPSRNRGQWLQLQERELAALILKQGRKWSSLASQMTTNRTENMVKKRYVILIKNLKKQYPKIKDEDDLLRQFLSIQHSLSIDSLHVQSSCEGKSQKEPSEPYKYGEQNKSIDQKQNGKEKAIVEEINNCLTVEQLAQKQQLKIPLEGSGFSLTPYCTPILCHNPKTPISPANHLHLAFNTFSSYEHDVGESFYYIRKSSD